jgi:hypothetical protein
VVVVVCVCAACWLLVVARGGHVRTWLLAGLAAHVMTHVACSCVSGVRESIRCEI